MMPPIFHLRAEPLTWRCASEVLEHLFQPQLAAAEILRVLKPGGVLITTVPNSVYWRRRIEVPLGRWNPMETVCHLSSRWRISAPSISYAFVFASDAQLRRLLSGRGRRTLDRIRRICTCARGFKRLYFPPTSRWYQLFETHRPSLFALRLHAIASKPDHDAAALQS